jgi:hypothetical protein
MPQQRRTAPGHVKQPVSWEDFYRAHKGPLNELLSFSYDGSVERSTLRDPGRTQLGLKWTPFRKSPIMKAADRLNELGVGPMLKAANTDNSPEAFRKILEFLIHLSGIEIPKGVFTASRRRGKPGRPISSESERIYSTWLKLGEPSPFRNDLAKAVYGVLFNSANGINRRKLRVSAGMHWTVTSTV